MHIALAYIDPGSGSLIIQMVIATVVAIPIFFRHQIGRFIARFRTPPPPSEATITDEGDSEP